MSLSSSLLFPLFFDCHFKFSLARLKRGQFLLEGSNLFLDLAQFCLSLPALQILRSEFFFDVPLQLTPQNPEIGVAPDRSFSVFKFAGSDALHKEVAGHSVFLLGRYIAEGCPFAIPFAVFRHVSSPEE